MQKLNADQEKMINWLVRNGAVSLSRLLAEPSVVSLGPKKVLKMLEELASLGLVIIRDDPSSSDGRVILVPPDYK